jgi:hypothetical protein
VHLPVAKHGGSSLHSARLKTDRIKELKVTGMVIFKARSMEQHEFYDSHLVVLIITVSY